jgi:Leucine-rich repeat (LRR) protein
VSLLNIGQQDDGYSVLLGHDQVKQLVLLRCSHVDPTVFQLAALESLTIKDSTMQSLPDEIGNLQALRELQLVHCKQLISLRESLGQLQELQRLELQWCNQLVS